jgi:hypothetical protein
MDVYLILAGAIVLYFLVLAWIFRDRPLTDEDRRCAAIERDIERREREAKWERRAESELYPRGGGWRG